MKKLLAVYLVSALTCGLSVLYGEQVDIHNVNDDDDGPGCNCKTHPQKPGCCGSDRTRPGSYSFIEHWGSIVHEEGKVANTGRFMLHSEVPSPIIFSPTGLNYEHPAARKLIAKRQNPEALNNPSSLGLSKLIAHSGSSAGTEAVDGSDWEIEIAVSNTFNTLYRVDNALGYGVPTGYAASLRRYVELVDANGAVVADNPTYVLEHLGNSDYIKYDWATGIALEYVSSTGRVVDLQTAIEVLFDGDVLRQVRVAQGLADVVVIDAQTYEIRFYTVANTGSKNGSTGFYEPTGSPFRTIEFSNPGDPSDYSNLRITDTWGSEVDVLDFSYEDAGNEWTLVTNNNKRTERKYSYTSDAVAAPTESPTQLSTLPGNERERLANYQTQGDENIFRVVLDENGNEVSRTMEVERSMPWGDRMLMTRIKDPEGIALTTSYTYYEDPASGGAYGRAKSFTDVNGRWERYEYDAFGRRTKLAMPWLDTPISEADSAINVRTFSFEPHDTGDVVAYYDSRPRTITETTTGIVTAKTYWVYKFEGGDYVKIEERVTSNTAAYGDASNLRTETRYYGSSAGSLKQGRMKSIHYSDGRFESYDYQTSGGNFIETMTMQSAVSGSPVDVAYKSTQMIRTWDAEGNLVTEQMRAFDGSTYQTMSTMSWGYNDFQQLTSQTKDGRTVLSQVWLDGMLDSRTDESGITMTFTYDELDRIETETKIGHGGRPDIVIFFQREVGEIDCGCDGETTVIRSAGSLSLTSKTVKDAVGRTSHITDEDGYTTSMSYAEGGRITTRTNPDTSTVVTENYLDGRLKSITGTGVVPEYYTYGVNSNGSVSTQVNQSTAASARYQKSTLDVAGRLIENERPAFTSGALASHLITYGYNDRGLLEKIEEPELADTLFTYDELSRIERSGLDINDNGLLDLASTDRITDTNTDYQLDGGIWYRVIETAVYDQDNQATAVTVASQRERMSSFTLGGANGDLISEGISEDVHGNETIQQTWVDRGAKTLLSITDTPESNIAAVEKLVNGLLVESNSTTVAAAIVSTYDDLERLVARKEPRHSQAISFTYHPATNLRASTTDGAGHTTSFEYYAQAEVGAPKLKERTDALLQKTYFAYDELGRQTQVWGGTDYPVEFAYDSFGQLQTLTTYRDTADAFDFTTSQWPSATGGDVTTWIYDVATGLLTRKQYADAKGTDYSYTGAGRLATRTWARGLTTTYSYDANAAELTSVDYSDTTPDLAFAYDRLGRQLTITDSVGTRAFAYNAQLQLETESFPGASLYDEKLLTRLYEQSGGALPGRYAGFELGTTSDTDSDHNVYLDYYPDGRLQDVEDPNCFFTYAYVPDSDLVLSLTTAMGTTPFSRTFYGYEPNRNLKMLVDNASISGSSTNIISSYTYVNDGIGRATGRIQEGSVYASATFDSFDYNSRSEVTDSNRFSGTDVLNPGPAVSGFDFDYSFDKIGNRETSDLNGTTTSYTPNQLNQYDAVGVTSPVYDDDGNLTDDGDTLYSWNAENRLIQIAPKVPATGDEQLTFTYDYLGRRVRKLVETYTSGSGWSLDRDRSYLYDQWNLIAEYNVGTIAVDQRYAWGLDLSLTMQSAGGVGGLLSAEKIGQDPVVYYYDANGNVMQLVDQAGNVKAHYDYGPFGELMVEDESNLPFENSFKFSTKNTDSETGLVYYGFRYYDSEWGRWLNRDPIGESGWWNVYAAFKNNANYFIDPLGLSIVPIRRSPEPDRGDYIPTPVPPFNPGPRPKPFIRAPRDPDREKPQPANINLLDPRNSTISRLLDEEDIICTLIPDPKSKDYEGTCCGGAKKCKYKCPARIIESLQPCGKGCVKLGDQNHLQTCNLSTSCRNRNSTPQG